MRSPYETQLLLPVIQVERRHRTPATRALPRRRLRDVVRLVVGRLHPWGATPRPGREPSRPGRRAPVASGPNPPAATLHQVPTSAR